MLDEHLADMYGTSPAESVHAMDHQALAEPSITLWVARSETGELLGFGALKEHSKQLGELKSMRTTAQARGRGIASQILSAILSEARRRGIAQVKLETGSEDFYAPARRLYERHGFSSCEPFADYTDDPLSAYYVLDLRGG